MTLGPVLEGRNMRCTRNTDSFPASQPRCEPPKVDGSLFLRHDMPQAARTSSIGLAAAILGQTPREGIGFGVSQ